MLHNSINGCFIVMQVICAHWKLDAWIIFSNPTIFLEIERSVVHSHTTMILTHQKIHVVMKANSLHYTHHRCRTGFWRFQEEYVLGTMTFFEFGFRFRSQRRALKSKILKFYFFLRRPVSRKTSKCHCIWGVVDTDVSFVWTVRYFNYITDNLLNRLEFPRESKLV